MRGLVSGLDTPVPMLQQMPGVFQDSDFAARFVSAFDAALAPVFCTLDNLAAYVDPGTAPEDLLAFVGFWVGARREDQTSVPMQRLAVADAVRTHRLRGTAEGLALVVRHMTGGEVQVTESGATAWSATAGGQLPGTGPPRVSVRVVVDDASAVDVELVRAAVAEVVPPYV
ncbi:MAG TPA: phage tail protein, partial [Candidatus Lustribacter sp.]|nr:phage tail protein [Candidatus Lustribacter sp.]